MGSWTARRLGALAGWWRSQDAAVRDGAPAVVLTAAAFVPGLSSLGAQFGGLPLQPADVLAALLVLGQTLPLAVRTRWPAPVLAITAICFAVYESLGYPPTFGSLGLYLALYSAGAWTGRFRRLLAVAATAGYVIFSVVLHLLGSPERLADYAIFYLALAAFWVVGSFVRRHRAEEAERRELKAREAASAERSRIARELHDVVTHHVTAMVVQADAGQFLTASPDRVAQSMTAISGTGRQALAELRYLLGVLEATGEPMPAGRTSSLGTLRDLVEQTRVSGQPVEFIEDGDSLPLAVDAELAVYRVAQEALTNAIKHAAGRRTVVRVGHEPGLVDIEVTTGETPASAGGSEPASLATPGARQPGAGRGLAGLHERVEMLGGEFMAAPQPGGGFRVHARIPSRSGS